MIYDLPDGVTEEHIRAARDAGASQLFCTLAMQRPDSILIESNFVTDKLLTLTEDSNGEVTEPSDDDLDRMGHFAEYLWDGDLLRAIYRADSSNTRLIYRTLSEPRLYAAAVRRTADTENAEEWHKANIDRFA